MARFEKVTKAVKDLTNALLQAKNLAIHSSEALQTSNNQKTNYNLSPMAVASALAVAMRTDNSDTRTIAILAANLATKYPQRAA